MNERTRGIKSYSTCSQEHHTFPRCRRIVNRDRALRYREPVVGGKSNWVAGISRCPERRKETEKGGKFPLTAFELSSRPFRTVAARTRCFRYSTRQWASFARFFPDSANSTPREIRVANFRANGCPPDTRQIHACPNALVAFEKLRNFLVSLAADPRASFETYASAKKSAEFEGKFALII